MKIAIMGVKEFAERVKKTIKESHHDVKITTFYYKQYIEVLDFLRDQQEEFDGILFPGYIAYSYAERHMEKKTVWEYIPMNIGDFYRALLEAEIQYGDIRNVSIDSYEQEFIYEAYAGIGISPEDTKLLVAEVPWEEESYYSELLGFHSKSYYNGKAKGCITAISEVYHRMKEMNLPCVRVMAAPSSILDAYNKLYIKYMENFNIKAEIAVMAVHIEFPSHSFLQHSDEYQELLYKQEIARQVSLFATRMNGSISGSDYDFLIFVNRKDIEVETDNLQNFDLGNLLSNKQLEISLGIGFGKNVKDAKFHAYAGMKRAINVPDNAAYVVYDKENMQGPIRIKQKQFGKLDNNLELRLIKTGMGIQAAIKLAEALLKSRKSEFTTRELTEMCGMSKRNMDRIIRKLEDVGFCQVVGEQKAMAAGRPARLIKFLYEVDEQNEESGV